MRLRGAKQLLLLFGFSALAVPGRAGVVTPRLASDGVGYLLVRVDERADPKRLLAQHLNANGGADAAIDLGPATIDFSGNYGGFSAQYPWYSVAFGASTYLVAWRQGQNIVVSRITPSGAILDSVPIALGKSMQSGPAISDQAIAWNGSAFIVAWQSVDASVVVSFVTEGGGVSAPVTVLPYAQDLDPATRIIWDGKHFLLSYNFYGYIGPGCHCFYPAGVVLLRVDSEGTLIDSPPALPTYLPTFDLFSFGYLPRWHLATNGFDAVMVAERPDQSPAGALSTAAFIIHPQGTSLQFEKPMILFDWFQLTFSDVAWDGRNFVASWWYGSDRSPSWIATTKFTSDGVIFDPRVSEVGSANQSLSPPAIAAGPQDQALVVTWETDPAATTGDRLETLRETDMSAMPPRPMAPIILSAAGFYPRTIVNWEYDAADAEGFTIEEVYPEVGYIVVVAVAGAADRTAVVQSTDTIRVRAFNSGGISDPSTTFHVIAGLRRRTAVH